MQRKQEKRDAKEGVWRLWLPHVHGCEIIISNRIDVDNTFLTCYTLSVSASARVSTEKEKLENEFYLDQDCCRPTKCSASLRLTPAMLSIH